MTDSGCQSCSDFYDRYDLSCYGFLPNRCLKSLPEKFAFLTPIANNLQTNDGHFFRKLIDELPTFEPHLYDVTQSSLEEIKFLYSLMSMVCHKYIWCLGPQSIKTILPKSIGYIWHTCATRLGLPCVLTHASVDLYNWSLISDKNEFCLGNVKSNYTMTGSPSEEWFYLIMVAIEGRGGSCLKDLYEIDQYLLSCNNYMIRAIMRDVNQKLIDIAKITSKMYEKCDPVFFFNQLRQYLSGSDNPEYFPQGLQIEGMKDVTLKMIGGSAAQSSLIQAFDIFFSVCHEGHSKMFLDKMRDYMPQKHRDYLDDLSKQSLRLKDYIDKLDDSLEKSELQKLFNTCLMNLNHFRNAHIKLVHQYISKFIKQEKKDNNQTVHGDKGTGGTDPNIFLTDVMRTTAKTKFHLESKNQKPFTWFDHLLVLIYVFFIYWLLST